MKKLLLLCFLVASISVFAQKNPDTIEKIEHALLIWSSPKELKVENANKLINGEKESIEVSSKKEYIILSYLPLPICEEQITHRLFCLKKDNFSGAHFWKGYNTIEDVNPQIDYLLICFFILNIFLAFINPIIALKYSNKNFILKYKPGLTFALSLGYAAVISMIPFLILYSFRSYNAPVKNELSLIFLLSALVISIITFFVFYKYIKTKRFILSKS